VFAIALGYEDLVDHDDLRRDPVLGTVLGRLDARRSTCAPLAGKSTLNRLEHAPAGDDRYHKIAHDPDAIETTFVDLFLDAHARPPARITLDLAWAEDEAERTGRSARRFADFRWTTRDSWSKRRRVVAKAEWMPGRGESGANPRFVVTSLPETEIDARTLYERVYCARGDMENRIKECQLDLFADRTSAATMKANQLRLWFASMAYVLLCALRHLALAHTELARATFGTIRGKLLKIGARVTVSVRRIRIAMASACPYADIFRIAHTRLCR